MSTLSNLLGALCVGVGDLQNTAMTEASGIDPATLTALLFIYARPSSSVGDIAKAACVTHSGAVRTLDRLVALGLAMRRRRAQDQRTAALSCTRAGSTIAKRALAARRAALDELLASTLGNKAERVVIKKLLEHILAGLRPETRADAWRICRLCEHSVCRGDNCPVGRTVA
jgi:DNA-binding MarR family transcriptional regulator